MSKLVLLVSSLAFLLGCDVPTIWNTKDLSLVEGMKEDIIDLKGQQKDTVHFETALRKRVDKLEASVPRNTRKSLNVQCSDGKYIWCDEGFSVEGMNFCWSGGEWIRLECPEKKKANTPTSPKRDWNLSIRDILMKIEENQSCD